MGAWIRGAFDGKALGRRRSLPRFLVVWPDLNADGHPWAASRLIDEATRTSQNNDEMLATFYVILLAVSAGTLVLLTSPAFLL